MESAESKNDYAKIQQLYHVKIHQWLSQVASKVSGPYVNFYGLLKFYIKTGNR